MVGSSFPPTDFTIQGLLHSALQCTHFWGEMQEKASCRTESGGVENHSILGRRTGQGDLAGTLVMRMTGRRQQKGGN